MGAGPSKHRPYPFPVPIVNSNGMQTTTWSSVRTKKGKEKAHPELYQQYSNGYPTAAYPSHGFQYYPQVQSGYPQMSGYYPVAMVPMQQPLVMPQAYVPVAAFQNAAGQPPVPVIHPAEQVRMLEPSNNQGPVMPNVTGRRDPVVPPPPVITNVQPQRDTAFPPPPIINDSYYSSHPQPTARMPEPHVGNRATPGPVIPGMTGRPGDPVVPAPPDLTDAQRAANSSSRPRFTDFYQPADHPISMPEPYLSDVPFRPPTVPPIRMATRQNPLPSPPRDIWDTTPYRQVLQELPKDITLSFNVEHMEEMEDMLAQPGGPISRLGKLFGSSSKRKGKSRQGLFRTFSTSGGDSESGGHHHRSNTVTSFVIPPTAVMPDRVNPYTGSGAPPQAMPVPDRGPPVKFDHTGELSGFVNHSQHRVMYKNKMYPTAMHLLEAMKFTEHPKLQERIRKCTDVGDMYPLSASFQDHVRPDWGQVFLRTMEDVLYIKFKQHPSLRTLLLRTGLADIVYADANDAYWGHGPSGDGANELGKALIRVRDRLRAEGER
ncbi:uncharacterized protein HD556DRAFT_1436408 [Suillus plorans]|uniref:NADAR domain-containing protein n=1 Tax=Suillus plorans TaxID=116603 RepID=A0A9P7DYT3_9AGAM|nr:uncharacterized protein HD556DRAFT_1436408 [Suillus plorans]KAG1806449.1 hypothetical protein HD556DRAFT_1436408 [Suillus plorans]